jgi:hypothetical protein
MAACFRSDLPGALQGDSAAPKQQEDPVPDPAAPVSQQSLRQDSLAEGEGQTQDTRPTYLEILKTALPLAAGTEGHDSESTLSEAAGPPVAGLSWADLSEDGWSEPDAQPEMAGHGTEQEPPVPDAAMEEAAAPDSSDEAEEPAAASKGRRRRRHRRKHREEPANEGILERNATDAGVAANRAVVAWADLGCSLLLGPAGGGATATVTAKAEPPTSAGVCSTFAAWSTLVSKPTGVHQNAGVFGVANTVPAAGHPQGPWLQFANGFPSYGVLAQQLHTAAPEACANLADLLHAAAPETYED